MKITVTHSTLYRYDFPVYPEPVELLRYNPSDYLLAGESLNLPLCYREPSCTALTPYRNDLRVGESVQQYAKLIAAGAQWSTLSFLVALSREIFQGCRQITRHSGPPWPSDRTLSWREGSCRDLAVLFCDCCRAMGIAARFVSGYECASASRQDSYMHAWAEVYLPGIGWRGYDPSRGLAVSNGQHRCSGRLQSRSRISGGWMVFRWIWLVDGGFGVPCS
jgi:transglutaminase-like putative cysteine protease